MQTYENLVDLVKSFPTSIYLQKSASIQPRPSLSKFGGKFNSLFIRLLKHESVGTEHTVEKACLRLRKCSEIRTYKCYSAAGICISLSPGNFVPLVPHFSLRDAVPNTGLHGWLQGLFLTLMMVYGTYDYNCYGGQTWCAASCAAASPCGWLCSKRFVGAASSEELFLRSRRLLDIMKFLIFMQIIFNSIKFQSAQYRDNSIPGHF